ncbi:MAG: CHAD domain-containing protein [Verrucomicrobia bacterium]|nr:CHAD domain-containing protein [Verrucomicrobiota bacterium]
MNRQLKRKEPLREGLQRIAEARLQQVLQLIGQDRLTSEPVHEARKAIKSLRATLRLTRGALAPDERRNRNQVLREFAGRLSGPRDAAVTLAAFEKACDEGLGGNRRPKGTPTWVTQVRQALKRQAQAPVTAESVHDTAEAVRRLSGKLLPLRETRPEDVRSSKTKARDDWETTVGTGLRQTYRQGRQLFAQIEAAPDSTTDEQWHDLRKRAKDLGYQLEPLKKVKGIKPFLSRLDEVGSALGDARDLTLVRAYLNKIQDKRELTPAERQGYRRLLAHIDRQCERLHRNALRVAARVYQSKPKKFTAETAACWHRWHAG